MVKRSVLAVFLLAAAPVAAQQPPNGLVVHEWGTFTSVAGPQGDAIQWRPLAAQSDLPCFVRMMTPDGPKTAVGPTGLLNMAATVRMETPVLYFYSPVTTAVRVHVSFPQGIITEWFPHAAVTPAFAPFDVAQTTGTIDWPAVTVIPDAPQTFLREPGESHYYAARATDAAPVSVNGQLEKFLFYRGIATFPVALAATVQNDGRILVRNNGQHDVPNVIVFENRGGKIGYRLAAATRGSVTIDAPELTANFDALRVGLEQMLVGQGLFAQEAKAMVATWRDSWFEEGTRLFYIVPRAAVDEILPLSVSPQPKDVARAFVGRLEIITPAVEHTVEQAFMRKDMPTLDRFGRFLEPIANRLLAKPSPRIDRDQVNNVLRVLAASHTPETPCR